MRLLRVVHRNRHRRNLRRRVRRQVHLEHFLLQAFRVAALGARLQELQVQVSAWEQQLCDVGRRGVVSVKAHMHCGRGGSGRHRLAGRSRVVVGGCVARQAPRCGIAGRRGRTARASGRCLARTTAATAQAAAARRREHNNVVGRHDLRVEFEVVTGPVAALQRRPQLFGRHAHKRTRKRGTAAAVHQTYRVVREKIAIDVQHLAPRH
mmetsp:Transcript_3879/g.11038  ORF Transcript_3879/g.11038 Transcript_3879/m.11038 type:complete len:208 (-) Transcript_3879:1444-2067(-)